MKELLSLLCAYDREPSWTFGRSLQQSHRSQFNRFPTANACLLYLKLPIFRTPLYGCRDWCCPSALIICCHYRLCLKHFLLCSLGLVYGTVPSLFWAWWNFRTSAHNWMPAGSARARIAQSLQLSRFEGCVAWVDNSRTVRILSFPATFTLQMVHRVHFRLFFQWALVETCCSLGPAGSNLVPFLD